MVAISDNTRLYEKIFYVNADETRIFFYNTINDDFLKYSQEQYLTETEKEKTQNNIGVDASDFHNNVFVHFDKPLDDIIPSDKPIENLMLQARENINANIKIGALSNTSTFHCSYPTTMDMDFRVAGRSKFSGGVDASTLLKTKNIELVIGFSSINEGFGYGVAKIHPDTGWTPLCVADFIINNSHVHLSELSITSEYGEISVFLVASYTNIVFPANQYIDVEARVTVLLIHTG